MSLRDKTEGACRLSRFGPSGRLSRWISFAATLAGCLGQPLLAQAPLNDAFPGQLTLTGSTNAVTGSNAGASSEPGEPSHADNTASASVWWTWIAPDTGVATLDTLDSTFDTVLAVYIGDSVNALTLIAANDEAPGLATSLVSFSAIGGTSYRIAVDGYRGASGAVQLNIRLPVAPAPPAFTSYPTNQTVPDNAGSNVTFGVTVTGSFPRSFEWQRNGVRLVIGADSSYTITNAILAHAGDYRVIFTNSSGSITSSVAVLNVRTGLAQDSFDGRVAITGTTTTVTAHNIGATTEADEPLHAGVSNGASVWWSWTAPQNGLTRVDTAGSTNALGEVLDTVLAVYSGRSLSGLVPLASNNDEISGLVKSSKLYFRAIAGVAYPIAVAGLRDTNGTVANGEITLNLAQFPDNDSFANALAFPPGVTAVYDDNTGATVEAGEPPHVGNPGGKSVWWYWVAPSSGTYVLDTVGSSIDTVLAVYTGTSVNTLTLISEDDNRSDDGASLVKFAATGGTTYRFAVDGFSGTNGVEDGPIILNLNSALETNDNFADRTTLSGRTNRVTGSNVGASKEIGEPNHAGNAGGRSVWWTWTAHLTAPVIVTTRNSSFDTALAVYTGTQLSSLALVAENDDSDPVNPSGGSSVIFLAQAEQTYQIAVDGYRSGDGTVAEGSVVLGLAQAVLESLGGNDMFANRFSIIGPEKTVIGLNTNASEEAGEPNHAGNDGGRSLWWSWVAPASTPVKISTLGSSFDTELGVYQGSSVSALTFVAADQDSAGGGLSIVTFDAVEGVEYQIAVDGFNNGTGAESGRVVLSLHQYPAGPLLANDDFEHAAPISSQFPTVSGLNIGATRQPGEPAHGTSPPVHSVWWTWTASSDAPVTISTVNSQFDTILSVYTGPEVASLSLVAENDDIDPFNLQSKVSFQAVAGTIYRLAVDGYGGQVGLISLTVSPGSDVPSPPQIQQAPLDQTRFSGGDGGGTDVTFRVVATGTLPMSFQWLRNGDVLAGATNDVLTLTNAAANDIGSYQVTMSNRAGVVTSAAAEFTWFGAPFNDDFASRILITGSSNLVKGSILGASKQLNEPHHGGEAGGRSVWWRWVAPATGLAEMHTLGSSFDTLLAVYQGNDVSSLTLVAENDDLVSNRIAASRVVFSAVAGQEYQIGVDGQKTNGMAGAVLLTVRQPPLVDTTKPVAVIFPPSSSLTSVGPVTFRVNYTDLNFEKSTLSVADVTLNKTGTADGVVTVFGSGLSRTVTISSITGDGTLGISLAAGTAADTVGNTADAAGPSATFEVDNTKPAVSLSGPSSGTTESGPVTYTVTYADVNLQAITLGLADIQLSKTGSASGTVTVLNNGTTATVTISAITGRGTLGISLAGATAVDKAGNMADATSPSLTFTVLDTTAPVKPDKPDLIAAHDTGLSNSDDITSSALITLVGTGETGGFLALREGSTLLAEPEVVAGSWSLTLTNPLPGAHTWTATLTDPSGNTSAASDPLLLIIDRTAPTISVIPDQFVSEDGILTVTFDIGDSQAAASDLQAQAISSNASLIPNSNLLLTGTGSSRTLKVTPVSSVSGNSDITLTVTDVAGNAATRVFQVTVQTINDSPTLNAIPPQSVLEASGAHVLTLTGISSGTGESQNLTVRAISDNVAIVDHPAAVFTSPAGTAALTFSPVGHANGKATISVIITDDGGTANGSVNAVTNKFDVTVQPVNFSPVVQAQLADRSGVYGTVLSFTLPANSFADPDPDDTLTYTATGTPTGMVFDSTTRTFSGTPQAAGAFPISVTAKDASGLSAVSSFRLAVGKAPLVIKADNQSIVYGAALPPLTATYTGFAAGDTAASLLSPAILSTPATPASNAGSYPITVAGAASPNYEISFSPGTLNISRAALRIAAVDATSVYGDAIPSFTPLFTGFVAGDTSASLDVPVALSSDATRASTAGTYPIKVAGGDDANYTVDRVDGVLTIAPAPLTVRGDDLSRSYGAPNPALSGAIIGLKNGESVSVTYATTATIASAVGTYPITPAVTDPSGVLSHYTLAVVPGRLTVLALANVDGVVFDGYVAGGTVFFDANNDRKLEAGEPSALTDNSGKFNLAVSVADFDRNHNGEIEPSEGVLVLTGGIDISTGLPLKAPLTALFGATVVTPLTTLITSALEQNSSQTASNAQAQIKASLGLASTVDLNHYDPFASLSTNDPAALKVLNAGAKVQDSLVQITALLASSSGTDSALVSREVGKALAAQILTGDPDLAKVEVVQAVIQNSAPGQINAGLVPAAARLIAENNAAKNAVAATNFTATQAVLEIAKLQSEAQRQQADAMTEAAAPGVSLSDSLAILAQAEAALANQEPSVGVVDGQDTRPGQFNFNAGVYQVSPIGLGSAKITVVRSEGNSGAGKVGLKVGTGPSPDPIVIEFANRETSKTVDLLPVIKADSQLSGLSQISLRLQAIAGTGTNAPTIGTNAQAVLIFPSSAPVIVNSPVNTQVLAGNQAAFTVGATGTPQPQFQWWKDGKTLAGQTNADLVLVNVQPGDAGNYQVVASNSVGTATSPVVMLRVIWGPVISGGQVALTVLSGTSVSLSFVVEGSAPLQYQWSKNGAVLAGQTNVALNLGAVTTAHSGSYSLEVANDQGTSVGRTTDLTVTPLIFQFLTIQQLNDGSVNLALRLPVGRRYRLEESIDLQTWTTAAEVTPESEVTGVVIPARSTSTRYFRAAAVE